MSTCCTHEERRQAVRRLEGWNGIDYVEVAPDQRSLMVYFLGKLPPELAVNQPGIEKYLALDGGQRITGIQILDVDPKPQEDPELDDWLEVRLDRAGDFSTYTLRLVDVANIDPRYDAVQFSFKIDCPSELDCAPGCGCAPPELPQPEINYLAKDYASFRQLMLDRMALLVPNWTERHVPDLGLALVETIAYEGDYLSYYQDAVATEAYLQTARQRTSVRRHVRLVDYRLHEGCNARAWVALSTDAVLELDPTAVSFITGLNGRVDARTVLEWDDLAEVPAAAYEVFEPYDRQTPIRLNPAHNEIHFHTWGNRECCLEKGATSAALVDTGLTLKIGDWLIFEEVRGPITGSASDADPLKRHAVRLTELCWQADPVVRDANGEPVPYLAISWSREDALPFALCLSAIGAAPACSALEFVSVARGNVVLVDHGRTVGPEDLGAVPEISTEVECLCEGQPGEVQHVAGPYRPVLSKAGLTFRQPLPAAAPATSARQQDPRSALPQVELTAQPGGVWQPRYDLLGSSSDDAHFVIEMDNDGAAHLRFGNGQLGAQPAAGAAFQAVYRTGNGTAGNVGAESISRLVLRNLKLNGVAVAVRNPLPATGGLDAETLADARLLAPHAYRQQIERAIIAADYDEIAGRNPHVERASTELVWTGSWYEADVAIDPRGSETLSSGLQDELLGYLEPYRRMGHDLHVETAVYVPLDLKLTVCTLPGYQAGHVKAALEERFSNRRLGGGRIGFFHPDNQSFGEGIYLSALIAAAQAVPGVECVTVTRFERQFVGPNRELENGVLPLAANEIAQLDNDPNYPEHGQLTIEIHGGR